MSDGVDAQLAKLQADLSGFLVSHDDFTNERSLGRGTSGQVNFGHRRSDNTACAIKELLVESPTARQLLAFCREVRVMSKCDHPCVVPFVGFCLTPPLTIVTRFIPNGTLYDALYRGSVQLSGTEKTKIAMGLAAGMACLHEESVVHRDLKSGKSYSIGNASR
jgi:serine/threonine protein kinase